MKKLFCGVLSIIFCIQEIESMNDSTNCPISTPELQSEFRDYLNKKGEEYVQNKVAPLGTVEEISKVITKPGSTAERVFEPVIKIETAADASEAIEQLKNLKNHATGVDTVISNETKSLLPNKNLDEAVNYFGLDTVIGKSINAAALQLKALTNYGDIGIELGVDPRKIDLTALHVDNQDTFVDDLSTFLMHGPSSLMYLERADPADPFVGEIDDDYVENLLEDHLTLKEIVAASIPPDPDNPGNYLNDFEGWQLAFTAALKQAPTYSDGCTVCLSYLKSILRTIRSRQVVLESILINAAVPDDAAIDINELINALNTEENKQIIACDPYVVQQMIDGAYVAMTYGGNCVADIVNINTNAAVTAAVGGGNLRQLIADNNQAVIDAILDIGHEALADDIVKGAMASLFINQQDICNAAVAVGSIRGLRGIGAIAGLDELAEYAPAYAYTHLLKLLTDDYTALAQHIIQNLIIQILNLDPVPVP